MKHGLSMGLVIAVVPWSLPPIADIFYTVFDNGKSMEHRYVHGSFANAL